jgi:hypothetical protein
MTSWLRSERVYRSVMNGALWTAFLAALASGRWPQLGWAAGCVTAVMVVVAAIVYCITPHDDERERNRPETLKTPATENASRAVQEVRGRATDQMSERREEITRTELASIWAHFERHTLLSNEAARWSVKRAQSGSSEWEKWEKLYLLYSAQHYAAESSKTHRLLFASGSGKSGSRILPISSREEDLTRVVFTVGSVTIEITDDDQKTTNIHITSPKTTVVTNDVVGARAAPETTTKNRSTIH